MATVAVDAMGGDHAPGEIVAGALRAHRERGVGVLLAGPSERLRAELGRLGAEPGGGLEVVEAPDAVPMDAPEPALAVRAMRQSSVAVACRLVASGRADAVFSAGPTGATVAAAVLEMGRMPGAGRPAVAAVLPFPRPAVLVDAGANVDVRPEHLASFAVLGSVFAEVRLGLAAPRVGLLSVGEEPGKGSALVREAYGLLEAAGVNFVGNVEGRDIPAGKADVVVTDGFTGNVVLKLLEGFAKLVMGELLRVMTATPEAQAASAVLLPGLLELREQMRPERAGGAHLVGVKGVCIIGHGASTAEAVCAAIDVAAATAEAGLVGRVAERLARRAEGRSGETKEDGSIAPGAAREARQGGSW